MLVWHGLWRKPYLAAHPRRNVLSLLLSVARGYRAVSERYWPDRSFTNDRYPRAGISRPDLRSAADGLGSICELRRSRGGRRGMSLAADRRELMAVDRPVLVPRNVRRGAPAAVGRSTTAGNSQGWHSSSDPLASAIDALRSLVQIPGSGWSAALLNQRQGKDVRVRLGAQEQRRRGYHGAFRPFAVP
jgi:hypothetical protein